MNSAHTNIAKQRYALPPNHTARASPRHHRAGSSLRTFADSRRCCRARESRIRTPVCCSGISMGHRILGISGALSAATQRRWSPLHKPTTHVRDACHYQKTKPRVQTRSSSGRQDAALADVDVSPCIRALHRSCSRLDSEYRGICERPLAVVIQRPADLYVGVIRLAVFLPRARAYIQRQ